MSSERELDRVQELRAALRKNALDHESLEIDKASNGGPHLTVSLREEPSQATLTIRERNSVLRVSRYGQQLHQRPLDLRFGDGFCWDEITCATADELARLLLQHTATMLGETGDSA